MADRRQRRRTTRKDREKRTKKEKDYRGVVIAEVTLVIAVVVRGIFVVRVVVSMVKAHRCPS